MDFSKLNRCEKCRAIVGPGERLCTECRAIQAREEGGEILQTRKERKIEKKKKLDICWNCFEKIEPQLYFCIKCGASLQPKKPQASLQPKKHLVTFTTKRQPEVVDELRLTPRLIWSPFLICIFLPLGLIVTQAWIGNPSNLGFFIIVGVIPLLIVFYAHYEIIWRPNTVIFQKNGIMIINTRTGIS